MSQTLAADETKLGPPVRTRKGTNEGFLSDTVVRSRVVLEILNTERDYVKHLEDVVEVSWERVDLLGSKHPTQENIMIGSQCVHMRRISRSLREGVSGRK